MKEEYWLTPPELYARLDQEFHFDFDPCPYPREPGYNAIESSWGRSNYVNPPFRKHDGIGPTAFMRKAIAENRLGKQVVLVAPVQSYVCLMLEAGAEIRSLGRVRWLSTTTGEPTKAPSPIAAFILRGEHNGNQR